VKALYKLLSYVFLVIFLYPVLFQSAHILNSHSQDAALQQQFISDSNNSLSVEDEVVISVDAELEDDCPVCEYEFSIKKLDVFSELHLVDFTHQSEYLFSYSKDFSSNYKSKIHLRGPPVLS